MNSIVSFELVKLLKEKGFNLNHYLTICDENHKNLNSNYNPKKYQPWYFNLTIGEVVMWLYDNHKIYIHISPHGEEEDLLEDCKWWFSVYKNKLYNLVGGSKITKDIEDFGSLAEAYEAAIKYALNNLV